MDASDRLSTLSYNEQPPSNLSLASSGMSNNTAFILVLKNIFLVSTPTICVTAVTGNVLAFFVFVSKSLRRTSCSWYLAARSVSDSGFLIFNFLSWLSETFSLNFIHLAGMCQVFVFFTYLFSFLSVWLTVVVTLENYVRICRPFSVQKFCNTLIARNTILVLVSVGILLYNFPFWVNVSVATSYGNSTLVWCKFKDEFKAFMKAVLFVDTLTTLVVPSILIVVLMVAITFSLIKSLKRQSRLQGVGSRSACTNGETGGGGRGRSKSSPQAKVTRMLFAVSFFFILLNGPSHFIRAYRVFLPVNPTPVNQTSADHQALSPGVEEQAQVFCEMIYYLCFAVNLVIYLTFGRSFRKQFKETYFSYCLRHNSPSGCSEMTAMSTVRLEEIENRNEDQAALIEPNANKDNNNTGS